MDKRNKIALIRVDTDFYWLRRQAFTSVMTAATKEGFAFHQLNKEFRLGDKELVAYWAETSEGFVSDYVKRDQAIKVSGRNVAIPVWFTAEQAKLVRDLMTAVVIAQREKALN